MPRGNRSHRVAGPALESDFPTEETRKNKIENIGKNHVLLSARRALLVRFKFILNFKLNVSDYVVQ